MSRKLSTEDFKNKLNSIYGNQFDVLSEYINNCTKITLRCNICGGIITKRPSKMITNSREGCYICSGKNRYKDKDLLQKEVDSRYPEEYEILGNYKGARTKISVKRIPCGHIYDISPDNLLRGKGCPRCSIRHSHYMDIVESYLNDHNILYEKEKCFSDCRNIRCLPFDYYIEDKNICIEVDGEFHFKRQCKSINYLSDYDSVITRDNIKTEYCKRKHIKLIRLPFYLEDQFENILEKELHVNTEVMQPN